MKRLEWYFTSQGYQVINVTYRSRHCTMRQLSDVYLHQLLTRKILNQSARVHFVTHSMGGIILRQYLSNHYLENLGRVIMLAPPNHGSEIIDLLKSNPLTRSFLSLGGRELGTGINDVPQQLGPVQFECGVIACDRSLNPFLSYFLPGPNDGKVTVESAKIEGMRDFLLLHNTHTWLMWRKATLQQTRHFLEKGYFNRNFSDTIEKNCGN
ncbi:MAG: acetyltransferase [Pedosphaera sp.]|nr:acetyltransferase [Pedosphaera sp.]